MAGAARTRPRPERTPGAPLASGLNLTLATILGVLLGLGLAAWVSIGELRRQIDHWWSIERVDTAREDLVGVLGDTGDLALPPAQLAQVQAALATMSARIDTLAAKDPNGAFGAEASAAMTRARSLLVTRELRGREAAAELRSVETRLMALAELASKLAAESRRTHAQTARRSRQLEARQHRLEDQLRAVTDTAIAAEEVRRQVEMIPRYNESAAGQSRPLHGLQIDLSRLPAGCDEGGAAGARLAQNVACEVSSARLRATVGQLVEADAAGVATAAMMAVQAADAYARALEQRYRALATDLRALAAEADEESKATALLRLRDTGIVGITEVVADLGVLIATVPEARPREMDAIHAEILDQISRIRQLREGYLGTNLSASDTATALLPMLQALERDWSRAFTATLARQASAQGFEAELAALAQGIATRTAEVRDASVRWVQFFTRTTAGVILAMALLIGSAALASYRYISVPLAQVTWAILRLADGRTERWLRKTRGSPAVQRLGAAVERLREAEIERRQLQRRNAEQKEQIETQMRELAAASSELEHQARHDALTGLPNRRFCDEYLPAVQARSELIGGGFALLQVDVDRFKEINDTIGHDAGDFILRHVSATLREELLPCERVFRIGGDEFLIVSETRVSKAATEALADRIVSAMNVPLEFEGHVCRIGASIGISFGDEAEGDAKAALVNADMALYHAKREGRNRFAFFSTDLQREAVERRALSDRLMLAIEREEFFPVFQPQFDSETLALWGVETLVRWRHPDRGVLAPAAFLDVAQELRLMGQIDRILFEKAAADLRALKARGIAIPKISFNVTADRLMHHDIAQALRSAIDPEVEIAVELLESMSLDNLTESVRWAIDTLKEHDIRVEIDDFGSCRASIAGLIAVGPDAMKIDQTIIGPVTSSKQHLALVHAIAEIGETLGITVVAEGVETEEHVKVLCDAGCDVLQGYALAQPMAADELARFLQTRRVA